MAHFFTTRGKLHVVQGLWADAGATAVDIGLLVGSSVPAAIDTQAEIEDLNTVAELLALTGVDEPVGGWYSRKDLTRTALEEDDVNNRIDAAISAVVWTAATAGESIYGAFWWDATTDTNDTTRILIGVATFTAIPLNGSDFQINAGDLWRAS